MVRLANGYYHYWCLRDYDTAFDEFTIAEKGMPGHYQRRLQPWGLCGGVKAGLILLCVCLRRPLISIQWTLTLQYRFGYVRHRTWITPRRNITTTDLSDSCRIRLLLM